MCLARHGGPTRPKTAIFLIVCFKKYTFYTNPGLEKASQWTRPESYLELAMADGGLLAPAGLVMATGCEALSMAVWAWDISTAALNMVAV